MHIARHCYLWGYRVSAPFLVPGNPLSSTMSHLLFFFFFFNQFLDGFPDFLRPLGSLYYLTVTILHSWCFPSALV